MVGNFISCATRYKSSINNKRMKKGVKKKIRTNIGYISGGDLDGFTFEEAVKHLKEKMPENSKLNWQYGDNYYDVLVEREETDKEYIDRTSLEICEKEKLELQEKEMLRKLKQKYERQ